jgi:hypothetical protein
VPTDNVVCEITDILISSVTMTFRLKTFSYLMQHTINHCQFSWFINLFCS